MEPCGACDLGTTMRAIIQQLDNPRLALGLVWLIGQTPQEGGYISIREFSKYQQLSASYGYELFQKLEKMGYITTKKVIGSVIGKAIGDKKNIFATVCFEKLKPIGPVIGSVIGSVIGEELKCTTKPDESRSPCDVGKVIQMPPVTTDVIVPDAQPAPKKRPSRAKLKPEGALPVGPTPGSRVYEAYSLAYQIAYGKPPLRNGKIMSQCKTFASYMPLEDALGVVRFYLSHHDQFYVRNLHEFGLALRDAQKLHTEWQRGVKVTNHMAQKVELAASNQEVAERWLAKKAREEADQQFAAF